jgi:hypothetical protein
LRAWRAGSFAAPYHEYRSHLELVLTATDSDGESLRPSARPQRRGRSEALHGHGHRGVKQVDLDPLASDPQREQLCLRLLSDGGAQTHNIIARSATTYNAIYLHTAMNTTRLLAFSTYTMTTLAT